MIPPRSIPDIIRNLPDVEKRQVESALAERDGQLEQLRNNLSVQQETLLNAQKEAAVAKSNLDISQFHLSEAQSQIQKILSEKNNLQQELEELKQAKVIPRIPIKNVVADFQKAIAKLNKEAEENAVEKNPAFFVDDLYVEIRTAGLDVSDDIQLVPLNPEKVTSEGASIVRFNLRPRSTIRVVDED